jgi:hypothetical protein
MERRYQRVRLIDTGPTGLPTLACGLDACRGHRSGQGCRLSRRVARPRDAGHLSQTAGPDFLQLLNDVLSRDG